jgi:hypothetical protein
MYYCAQGEYSLEIQFLQIHWDSRSKYLVHEFHYTRFVLVIEFKFVFFLAIEIVLIMKKVGKFDD